MKKYLVLIPLIIVLLSVMFFNYAKEQFLKNERAIKTNTIFAVADNLHRLASTDTSLTEQQIRDIVVSVIEYVDTAYYMTFAAVYDKDLKLLTNRHIELEARGSLDPREYYIFMKAINNHKNIITELDFKGIHYYIKSIWVTEEILVAIGISDLSIYDFSLWLELGTLIFLCSLIIFYAIILYLLKRHYKE